LGFFIDIKFEYVKKYIFALGSKSNWSAQCSAGWIS